MALLTSDPVTQLAFSVYENKGVYALLLGSGLSSAAQIPTGWAITLDLVRRVATAQGIPEQNDWAKWYHERTGREPGYSVLLEELAATPSERRAILDSYIEPSEQDREEGRRLPTAAHRAIAALVRDGYIRVVITTNFDRLLENALREVGVEPTIIGSPDALAGAAPLTHSQCFVLKLHGDYKDARIRNTDVELSSYPVSYKRLLDRVLDEYGLLVCGWSGAWDHALRSAILRAPNRRYPTFWASRGEVAVDAQSLIDQRKASVISIGDADSFFSMLQARVEVLEKSHRQNPRTVELLVGGAKRYLAKPEFRIQLDELYSQEFDRVASQMQEVAGPTSTPWSVDEAHARVQRLESLTEPLAKMAGVLGRWGDGPDIGMMRQIVCRLLEVEPVGGTTAWIKLRAYPAVLVLTAYALGMVQAERWSGLCSILNSTIQKEHEGTERLVDRAFMGGWDGGDNDFWRCMPGLERRKTAFSDHLQEVLSEWRSSFVGPVPDFEQLFSRLELLGGLVYMDRHETNALEEQVKAGQWEWIPPARYLWSGSLRAALKKELATEPLYGELLKSGISLGDRKRMNVLLANIEVVAGKYRWMG